MKKLVILLFGFLVGIIYFSGMQGNSTASDKTFSAFELCQNPPLFGDHDLSVNEEEDSEVYIFRDPFTAFCKQSWRSKWIDYQKVCSLNTQISPHHFTNLHPPDSHVILYL